MEQEAELATHTAEFEEEKKLRAAVKKETREAKKEAKRVGGTIAERQYVLDEMLKQATLAQRKADQDWAAAQRERSANTSSSFSRARRASVVAFAASTRKTARSSWARRSMHQGCLLKPLNLVFCPFFTHFSPFFAHFQRLDARNPGSTARSPGENGKKSGKIVENRGN